MIVGLSGCLGVDTQNPENSGIPQSVDFSSETISYDDRLIFRYIPHSNMSADYVVSYEITEDGNIFESVDERQLEGISSQNPIELNISRDIDSAYRVNMSIKDRSGKVVHNDSISIHKRSDN